MIDFKQLTEKDDLEGINRLFACDGRNVYQQLVEGWFQQGIQMYINGESIEHCWNQHQRAGYKAYQVVKTAVAEMFGVN